MITWKTDVTSAAQVGNSIQINIPSPNGGKLRKDLAALMAMRAAARAEAEVEGMTDEQVESVMASYTESFCEIKVEMR